MKAPSLAKITRPRTKGILHRKRLFRLLDKSRDRPIIWILGPPGSGKTTLIASYLDSKELPCLWYQIDEGDSDMASFFYYMGLAAKRAAPRKRKPLPLLTHEYLYGISTFTKRYFENLYSSLTPPILPLNKGRSKEGLKRGKGRFLIVFDNYQDILAASKFHDLLIEGLTIIPKGINVIFISRSEPPPAFARMRANNLIKIIGWDELRLTVEESGGIIRSQRKGKHSEEEIRNLHNKTDGWAAGLILMLEYTKTTDFKSQAFKDLNPQIIFDYFAGEIFKKADQNIHNVLLKTSFLPKVTAHMAEKLTGLDQAGKILSDLNRSNYFTIRLVHTEPLYQYHPLFREFLLSRVRDSFSREEISILQRNAATLLEESNQIEDAAELYIAAGKWEELVRLVLKYAQSLVMQGRSITLEKWLSAMPEEISEKNPWIFYYKGLCSMSFRPDLSYSFFERAFQIFNKLEDTAGIFMSWSGSVESIIHEHENFSPLDSWIALLDDLLKKYSFPSQEIEDNVASKMFIALSVRQPQHSEFNLWKVKALELLDRNADPTLKMLTGFYGLIYYMWTGDYTEARELLERLKIMAEHREAPPLAQITAKTGQAWYCWNVGRDEECLENMEEGLKLAEKSGIFLWNYLLMINGVASSLSSGKIDKAEALLSKIAIHLDRVRSFDRFYYYYQRAWQSLLKSDLASALTYQKTAFDIAKKTALLYSEAEAYFGTSQLYHESGERALAEKHLREAFHLGRLMKSKIIEFMCLIAKAQYAFDQGKETEGLKSLKNAMKLGKESNYINFVWWRPSVMTELCMKALESGIEIDYVQDLIRKRELIPEKIPPHIENWPWPLKIFTLGRFGLLKDGKPLRFSKKVPQRPLDLLKALIAFGGREVEEEQLTDSLWPDAEGDTAHKSFKITLHRLRQLIGSDKAIQLREGRLTLDPRYCYVDLWAFERTLGNTDSAWKDKEMDKAIQLTEKALTIYKGHFLPGDEEKPWTLSIREHLKSKFIHHIGKLGRYLEEIGKLEEAIECYKKGLEVDDLAEEFYQNLMSYYHKLGQKAEALSVYNRCQRTLKAILGVEPSPRTEELKAEVLKR
jgi:ATP/maltotriose-dependent transcriptional regulator MalT/DNA-binding SARP family transcriptional activator